MILFVVVASSLLGQVLGVPIVEGRATCIQIYTWLVSIQRNGYHHCVGSIISYSIILTAAHCTYDDSRDSFAVRAGSLRTNSGGSWHRVVAIKRHENYQEFFGFPNFQKDVALMKVSPPFNLDTSGYSKIQLASRTHKFAEVPTVTIAGLGSTFIGGQTVYDLKSTTLRIVDSSECADAYGNKTLLHMTLDKQICTSQVDGGDACSGDSGGPLVDKNFIQVGVISWGIYCAFNRFPRVHQNVAYHRDWIDKNVHILESQNGSITDRPLHWTS